MNIDGLKKLIVMMMILYMAKGHALDINSLYDEIRDQATEVSENSEAKAKGLSAKIELGLVVTSGNSETTTSSAKFNMVEDLVSWRHNIKIVAIKAKSQGVNTVERYLFNLQSDRKLSEGKYLFGAVSHDIDKFSGFDYQSTLVFGYGKRFYDKKKFKLSADIGPGYRYSQFDAGGNEQESILHLGAKSEYIFTEATKLVGSLSIDNGANQTITFVDLGLVSKLTKSFAIKFNFNIKNSSNAPMGTEAVDTVTSINLVYGF